MAEARRKRLGVTSNPNIVHSDTPDFLFLVLRMILYRLHKAVISPTADEEVRRVLEEQAQTIRDGVVSFVTFESAVKRSFLSAALSFLNMPNHCEKCIGRIPEGTIKIQCNTCNVRYCCADHKYDDEEDHRTVVCECLQELKMIDLDKVMASVLEGNDMQRSRLRVSQILEANIEAHGDGSKDLQGLEEWLNTFSRRKKMEKERQERLHSSASIRSSSVSRSAVRSASSSASAAGSLSASGQFDPTFPTPDFEEELERYEEFGEKLNQLAKSKSDLMKSMQGVSFFDLPDMIATGQGPMGGSIPKDFMSHFKMLELIMKMRSALRIKEADVTRHKRDAARATEMMEQVQARYSQEHEQFHHVMSALEEKCFLLERKLAGQKPQQNDGGMTPRLQTATEAATTRLDGLEARKRFLEKQMMEMVSKLKESKEEYKRLKHDGERMARDAQLSVQARIDQMLRDYEREQLELTKRLLAEREAQLAALQPPAAPPAAPIPAPAPPSTPRKEQIDPGKKPKPDPRAFYRTDEKLLGPMLQVKSYVRPVSNPPSVEELQARMEECFEKGNRIKSMLAENNWSIVFKLQRLSVLQVRLKSKFVVHHHPEDEECELGFELRASLAHQEVDALVKQSRENIVKEWKARKSLLLESKQKHFERFCADLVALTNVLNGKNADGNPKDNNNSNSGNHDSMNNNQVIESFSKLLTDQALDPEQLSYHQARKALLFTHNQLTRIKALIPIFAKRNMTQFSRDELRQILMDVVEFINFGVGKFQDPQHALELMAAASASSSSVVPNRRRDASPTHKKGPSRHDRHLQKQSSQFRMEARLSSKDISSNSPPQVSDIKQANADAPASSSRPRATVVSAGRFRPSSAPTMAEAANNLLHHHPSGPIPVPAPPLVPPKRSRTSMTMQSIDTGSEYSDDSSAAPSPANNHSNSNSNGSRGAVNHNVVMLENMPIPRMDSADLEDFLNPSSPSSRSHNHHHHHHYQRSRAHSSFDDDIDDDGVFIVDGDESPLLLANDQYVAPLSLSTARGNNRPLSASTRRPVQPHQQPQQQPPDEYYSPIPSNGPPMMMPALPIHSIPITASPPRRQPSASSSHSGSSSSRSGSAGPSRRPPTGGSGPLSARSAAASVGDDLSMLMFGKPSSGASQQVSSALQDLRSALESMGVSPPASYRAMQPPPSASARPGTSSSSSAPKAAPSSASKPRSAGITRTPGRSVASMSISSSSAPAPPQSARSVVYAQMQPSSRPNGIPTLALTKLMVQGVQGSTPRINSVREYSNG